MTLQAKILERLPATTEELSAALNRSRPAMRNTLAAMYFDGRVGCDALGRYHGPDASSNGVPVVRRTGGKDVVA